MDWAVGKFGAAGVFRGSNSLVNAGSSTAFNTSALSVEAWIYPTDTGCCAQAIVRKASNDGSLIYNFVVDGDSIWLSLNGNSGNVRSSRILNNRWYHIAGTYDGSTVRVYINGVLDNSASYSQSLRRGDNTNLYIGGNGQNNSEYFHGQIQNVRISNTTRASFPYGQFGQILSEPDIRAGGVVAPSQTGEPSLIVKDVSMYQSSDGGRVVSVRVKNEGTAPTRNGFATDLTLDHRPSGPGDIQGSIQTWTADSLAPGQEMTMTTAIAPEVFARQAAASVRMGVESSTTSGDTTHTIYALADSGGSLARFDQVNKVVSSPVTACIAGADAYVNDESVATAKPIQVNGAAQTRNSSRPSVQRWSSFTATLSTKYTMATTNLGLSADTVLNLFDSDGVTVLAANDDYDSGLGSRIDWQAPSSATYYLRMTQWSPDAGGCGTGFDLVVSSEATPTPTRTASVTSTQTPTQTASVMTTPTPVQTTSVTTTPTPVQTTSVTTTPTPVQTTSVTPTPTPVQTTSVTPNPLSGRPVIVNVLPGSGSNTAATSLNIQGSGFLSGAQVALVKNDNSVALSGISVSSSTSILATVPPGLEAGVYDLLVTNPGSASGRLPRAFTVTSTDPVAKIVRPAEGGSESPNDLTIEGANFRDGVTAQLEKGGQVTALTSLTRISATRLRAVVPKSLAAGSYDLVLRNPGSSGSGRLTAAYTVFSSGVDDFFVGPDDIWTSPRTVRVGDTVQLGLNLHRRGGSSSVQVAVAFYLGDPTAGGTLLGRRTSVPISPTTESESVTLSWPVGTSAGSVTLYAVVDPDSALTEATRANNTTSRVLAIQSSATDTTPPQITGLTLADGSGTTTNPIIALTLQANDPAPGTGVRQMLLAEREFNAAARGWVIVGDPVWGAYSATSSFTLSEKPGVRYIQAWVADGAGNISLQTVKKAINYVPASDSLLAGQTRLYRRTLVAGETLTVQAIPTLGDPDLYVWGPTGNNVLVSNASGTTTDGGTFTASVAGVYQIEVFAYSDTTYRLTMTSGTNSSSRASSDVNTSKTARTQPVVAATDEPPGEVALPAVVASESTTATPTSTPGGKTYLSIVPRRMPPGGW